MEGGDIRFRFRGDFAGTVEREDRLSLREFAKGGGLGFGSGGEWLDLGGGLNK